MYIFIVPFIIKFFPDSFEDESKFCKALFIKKYPSSLSDRFLNEITSLPVHSITKDTSLYKLYNTNIHEKIAEQRAKENHVSVV
ncbi:MAG: hypothetical protein IIT46_08240 [Lachnospiraceae bacterium]|nr:hypothetical protein [Lachnospiraceae bacterium]